MRRRHRCAWRQRRDRRRNRPRRRRHVRRSRNAGRRRSERGRRRADRGQRVCGSRRTAHIDPAHRTPERLHLARLAFEPRQRILRIQIVVESRPFGRHGARVRRQVAVAGADPDQQTPMHARHRQHRAGLHVQQRPAILIPDVRSGRHRPVERDQRVAAVVGRVDETGLLRLHTQIAGQRPCRHSQRGTLARRLSGGGRIAASGRWRHRRHHAGGRQPHREERAGQAADRTPVHRRSPWINAAFGNRGAPIQSAN